jgi:guanylate kinase
MVNALEEMKYRDRYHAVIVNDSLEVAAEELYQQISSKSRNEEQ